MNKQQKRERELEIILHHLKNLDVRIHGTVSHEVTIQDARRPDVQFVITLFLNNQKIKGIIMNLTLKSNQFILGVLGLVDAATQQMIGASFSNQQYVSDNTPVVTAEADASDASGSTVKVTAKAEGSANLAITADATYNDSNGQPVTKSVSTSVQITIVKSDTGEQGVNLVVNFGEPQNQ